ncbi:MAG: hypothetical protein NC133_03630 [Prevotella sp.]|nr:hypothetical protein [Prevotella sp.]
MIVSETKQEVMMPSGHGHSSGGHFGGGFSGSRSGGHFGGSRSVGSRPLVSFGGRGWRHPHTMIFFGRPVYLGSARAGTVSILGVLIVLAIIASVIMGIGWAGVQEDLTTICDDYAFYQQMALDAADDEVYQLTATVTSYKQYHDSGKYCLFYTFETPTGYTVEGFTFYVYDYNTAHQLKSTGVVIALDTPKYQTTAVTDSVPLDFKDTVLTDDVEYVEYLSLRNGLRTGTLVALGVTAALIVLAILVPLTAKRATAEQLAENAKTDNGSTTSTASNTNHGTWRCQYCNTVNDTSKQNCEGCGAQRQN